MAILRAAATANDTLDDTSDTLVVGLTLTPAADDYLLHATVEALTSSSAGSETTTFFVFVGGTRLDHTQRQIEEESSIDNDNTVVTLNAKVSPNGSQAVEIRARTSGTASPLVAQRREMTLFPIPTGTDYEETATADDTKSGSTWITLGNMTRTPVSGDYLLVFSTTLSGPENQPNGANLRVSVGGSPLAHTVRAIGVNSSATNMDTPIALACEVNPNGSQVVEIEWMNAGTGTVTAHQRTMNLIPTASADIFEAQGTADDSDSTTTDKQIDDMLITDPGADDYLVIFTAYDFYGVIGNNVAETVYSIRAGGTKVTDSDRMNEHEGSLDSCDLPVAAGGRVTVAGATDDLQMFWQNGTTDTRTIMERTMVAIREATAQDFELLVDTGTYSVTGQDATPKGGFKVISNTGTYSLAGQDSILKGGFKVLSDFGTYSLTGQDAVLKGGFLVSANTGSYALSGMDAVLKGGFKFLANTGAYALTGVDTNLLKSFLMLANTGGYTLTGVDTNLLLDFVMVANTGAYSLSGIDATLAKSFIMLANSGIYNLVGIDANLLKGFILAANTGSYALSGVDATLRAARILAVDTGSYALSGIDAVLRGAFIIVADGGVYTLSGIDAGLLAGRVIAAESGTYGLSGVDTTLLLQRLLAADTGVYVTTGVDATLVHSAVHPAPLLTKVAWRFSVRRKRGS